MAKIQKCGEYLMFQCPACGCCHEPNNQWQFNGDLDKPTFRPSILVTGTVPVTDEQIERIMAGEKIEPVPTRCHSYVTDGKIEFLSDCTHAMAGQTVEIPEWE